MFTCFQAANNVSGPTSSEPSGSPGQGISSLAGVIHNVMFTCFQAANNVSGLTSSERQLESGQGISSLVHSIATRHSF
jgi:hypothetical protein